MSGVPGPACAARCLTEGVDVPNIDCILFADPRQSTIDIVQAVGRALRPARGKRFGFIILPVLMQDMDADAFIASDAFARIVTVLRALATNDERIVEYFRAIAMGKQRRGRGVVSIEVDERIAKLIDVDAFVEAVELHVWSKLAKLSWRPFGDAQEFARGLGLTGVKEWLRYCKGEMPGLPPRPEDVPSNPNVTYKRSDWDGWPDWLGQNNG